MFFIIVLRIKLVARGLLPCSSPGMRRRSNTSTASPVPVTGSGASSGVLPALATAAQLARVLQVSARTVHLWADAGTIPVALRQGRVVRFHPPAVAKSLGLDLPEFGAGERGAKSSPQTPDSGH